jgi:aspartyl-tRNA(Asn)/glutamyl-tRNA(Gln) amidotransferase subunit C
MKISDSEVLHVAALARLSLKPDEVERLVGELNTILDYMDLLSEADTSGVEPMHHPFPMENVFRDDVQLPSQSMEKALRNAPVQKDGFVVVPKVIE